MGRNKTPDSLKILKGTNQPCRLNGDTPNYGLINSVEELTVPTGLKGVAKKIFLERAETLIYQQILSTNDLDMLAIYAENVALAKTAQRNLEKDGLIIWVKDEEGTIIGQQINVWKGIYQDALKNINMFGTQFGFSPVSRIKLAALAKSAAPKNEFSDFIEITVDE